MSFRLYISQICHNQLKCTIVFSLLLWKLIFVELLQDRLYTNPLLSPHRHSHRCAAKRSAVLDYQQVQFATSIVPQNKPSISGENNLLIGQMSLAFVWHLLVIKYFKSDWAKDDLKGVLMRLLKTAQSPVGIGSILWGEGHFITGIWSVFVGIYYVGLKNTFSQHTELGERHFCTKRTALTS